MRRYKGTSADTPIPGKGKGLIEHATNSKEKLYLEAEALSIKWQTLWMDGGVPAQSSLGAAFEIVFHVHMSFGVHN